MGATDRHARSAPGKDRGGAAQWELRPLAAGKRLPGAMPLSARPVEAECEHSGYELGQQRGYADAQRSAEQARAADLQRLELLLGQMRARFDELAGRTADCLLDLALDIAAQVLRREVQTQRDAILPVVHAALALIVETHAHPTLRLAPQDFALVRAALSQDGQWHGCRCVEDRSIAPGGCLIESSHSTVDASLATRWRRVLQSLGCAAPAPEVTTSSERAPDAAAHPPTAPDAA